MNITELLITGFDGGGILFATTLTVDGARVIRPGIQGDGEEIVGQVWEKATGAFTTVRDLMNDIVGEPDYVGEDAKTRTTTDSSGLYVPVL